MPDRPETDDYEVPFPQYRCPACGTDLPLTEARMTVTCAEHRPQERVDFTVRLAKADDRVAIEKICDRAYGETEVDVFGGTYDVLDGVNLVAEVEGAFAGLLSLAVVRGDLAIVLMSVYPDWQGKGAGGALLRAAEKYAAERMLPAVVVAVTNDDIPQLYFYQRYGFVISEVAVGESSTRFGAAVPGFSGIPVRDEILLRRSVCGGR